MMTTDNGSAAVLNFEDRYAKEVTQARQFYRHAVLPKLKAEGNAIDGYIVVVDYENEDYEIDHSDVQALMRLRDRRPEAFLWAERIGYKTVYAIGGGSVRDD